jgi:cytoplasmic iron level regulating protein YaaA (DUF328/UPF0246 family)
MKTYKVTVDEKGTIKWYNEKGKLHREDGPAIEFWDGDKYWYLNGKQLTEEEFNNQNKPCIGKKVVIDGIEYTLK